MDDGGACARWVGVEDVVEWGRATVVAVRAAAPRREAARMYVCSILWLLLRWSLAKQ